jgi:Tfp pilus assembly pilus retraction ATPase PilT
MELVKLLEALISFRPGGDLHLQAGAPPMIRSRGAILKPLEVPPLEVLAGPADHAADVARARPRSDLSRSRSADFAFEMTGVARFPRERVLRAQSPGAWRFRRIPIQIPPLRRPQPSQRDRRDRHVARADWCS